MATTSTPAASTKAASASTSAASASRATAAAEATRTSARTAGSARTGIETTAPESSVDGSLAKPAQAETIAARGGHSRRQAKAAGICQGSASRSARTATSAKITLTASFIVASRGQAAAGAAVYEIGLVGVGPAIQSAESGARVERLLLILRRRILPPALGSRVGLRALKTGALLPAVLSAESSTAGTESASARTGRIVSLSTSSLIWTPPATSSSTACTLIGRGLRGANSRRPGGGCTAQAWHFESPILEAGLVADGDAVLGYDEAERLHLKVPFASRQVHRVAAVLIGVGNDLRAALACSNRGAGNRLVGRANQSGL